MTVMLRNSRHCGVSSKCWKIGLNAVLSLLSGALRQTQQAESTTMMKYFVDPVLDLCQDNQQITYYVHAGAEDPP